MAVADAGLGQRSRLKAEGQPVLLSGPSSVRRRANPRQGQALELLGHAVEYLVDSRVFALDAATARHNQEAVRILKELSRSVFHECAEVIPVQRRIAGWLGGFGRERRSV